CSSFLGKRGDRIRIRPDRSGLRAYLAVAGGRKVPLVMGSRSTCLKGGFGGLEGRPLRKGDIIETEAPIGHFSPKQLDPKYIPRYGHTLRLRVVLGPQDNHFLTERLLEAPFEISPRSDRMGIRLEGGRIPLREGFSSSIISEPVIPGAIQVTPDGSPLIILGEQTMGGYAKIATVIYPDLPLLSQARPGDKVSFISVGLEEAQRLYCEYLRDLEALKRNLI
ncbi:MAG: biotin-dependent carboxyltransferase family protein, partial [Desulfatiglandales bacterium]